MTSAPAGRRCSRLGQERREGLRGRSSSFTGLHPIVYGVAWQVVIAGGGFGGFYAARALERLLPPQSARVTLVNEANFLLYTPLLPGAAGAALDPRHVVVPLRSQLQLHRPRDRARRAAPTRSAGRCRSSASTASSSSSPTTS